MKRALITLVVLMALAVVVMADETTTAPVEPLKSLDEVVAALPHHDVSGTVYAPDGKPLKRAEAWLYFSSGNEGLRDRIVGKTKTDGKGRFKFKQAAVWEPVPASPYGGKPSYAVIVRKKNEVMGFMKVIEGEPLDNIRVNAHPMRAMNIRVKDADRKAVSGARVSLCQMHQPEKREKYESHQYYLQLSTPLDGFSGTTDASGTAKIYAIKESSFYAHKDGYAEGFSQEGGMVTLFPGIRVQGVATLPDGTLLPGAGVKATYQGNRLIWDKFTVADEQGRFAFDHLPTKGFRYSFMKPEEEQGDSASLSLCITDLRPGSPFKGIPALVDLSKGGDQELALTLQRAVRVSGRVVDKATRAPVKGFRLRVHTQVEGHFDMMEIKTDADGVYSLIVLPDTTIDAYAEEHSEEGNFILDDSFRRGGTRVFMRKFTEDAVLDDFEAPLWPVQSLTGRVVDETGKPAQARVSIHNDVPSVETDQEGRFTLNVAPTDRDFSLYAQTTERDKAAQVELKAGAREVEIQLASTRSYPGRVVNSEGLPAPNLKFDVFLRLNGSTLYRVRDTLTSTADGGFKLEFGCPQSTYSVSWSADNNDNRDYGHGGAKFSLAALPEDGVIQFEAMQYTNAILGKVTDRDGNPIKDAEIELQNSKLVRDNKTAHSDNTGAFMVPQLAAGMADLRIAAEGFKAVRIQTATDNVDLQVALDPKSTPCTRRIGLRLPDGQPAEGVDVICTLHRRTEEEGWKYTTHTFRTNKQGIALLELPPLPDTVLTQDNHLIVHQPGCRVFSYRLYLDEDIDVTHTLVPADEAGCTVKATDAAGQPIADAKVIVTYVNLDNTRFGFNEAKQSPFVYPVDSMGKARINAFEKASLNLWIQAPGYGSKYVNFQPGWSPEESIVSLAPASSVTVRVVSKTDQQPLTGIDVRLSGEDHYDDFTESEPGLYVADDIAPGEYTVYCIPEGKPSERYVISSETTLSVKEGQRYETTVPLEEGLPVAGQIKIAAPGEKMKTKETHIAVHKQGRHIRWARVEKDGRWQTYLTPGKYTLKGRTPGWQETTLEMEVTEGQTRDDLLLEFTQKDESCR